MIFFSHLTGFSYFPLEKKNPKVAGRDLNRSEMEVLKEGLDGFSYFVRFSIISFSNQNHPWTVGIVPSNKKKDI
jgi:hypothetical protein